MARSKKWIPGLTPEQPLTEAARLAIRNRLKAVWMCAPLAAKKAEENNEYVHDLRVATRRARAALVVFADLLPKRKTRRMQKTLRRLRRAAGRARDLDVLGERLKNIQKQNPVSDLSAVIEKIDARRCRAQPLLLSTYKRAKRKGFVKQSRKLAQAIRWREATPEPTFAEATRVRLSTLVDEFFTAAEGDLSSVESLHKLRISGKRLRYAMELLAAAFDDFFRRELYAALEEVQEKLGTINDQATAISTIGEWLVRDDSDRAQLAELIKLEVKQLHLSRRDFREWWTADRARELAQAFARPVHRLGRIAAAASTRGGVH